MSFNDFVAHLTRPARILLVDDEEAILELIPRFLQDFDCEFFTCKDVEEAVALIAKQKFDLVFIDLKLSGASGVQVLKFIKGYQPDLPAIVISGLPGDHIVSEIRELGIVTFVEKPSAFNSQTISALFEEALNLFKIRYSKASQAPLSAPLDGATVHDSG